MGFDMPIYYHLKRPTPHPLQPSPEMKLKPEKYNLGGKLDLKVQNKLSVWLPVTYCYSPTTRHSVTKGPQW